MKFFSGHDYDASMRIKQRAPRRKHQVSVCACGSQAWTPARDASVIMVSVEDRALLDEFRWTIVDKGRTSYAQSPTADLYLERGAYLHNNIATSEQGFQPDHHDGNGLNNMRGNLRPANKAQNQHNRKVKSNKKHSRFKGVQLDPRPLKKRWVAKIVVDEKSLWLGRHGSEEAAALAYDRAAKEHFGAFARLNYPEIPG